MATVNAYLNFDGTTEAAFNFYKTVFGGEFFMVQRYKDTPFGDKISESDREKIMHISLAIGDGTVLMATDAVESMGQKLVVGNNFSLCIHPGSEEEANKFFNALSANGQVTMPLEKAFWGAYFGMLTDQFGIQWMVNFDEQHQAENGTAQKKNNTQFQNQEAV